MAGVGRVHTQVEKARAAERAPARAAARLEAIQERAAALESAVQSAAEAVAALPDAPRALAGDRAALVGLFRSLEGLRAKLPDHPSLAVHASALAPLAWADRVQDLRAFQGVLSERKDVLILQGSVTTYLVATVPVRAAGGVQGLATATLLIAARRNIRNEFLADFDLVAGPRPGVEIRYVDARDEAQGPPAFDPLPPGAGAEEGLLRARDGSVLAAVRVGWRPPESRPERVAGRYRWGVTVLACAAVLAWALLPSRTARARRLRLVAGATLTRGLLLVVGPLLPDPRSTLLSPDAFASVLMGPLLKSPLDLFLTASWLLVLALVLFETVMAAAAPASLDRARGSGGAARPAPPGSGLLLDRRHRGQHPPRHRGRAARPPGPGPAPHPRLAPARVGDRPAPADRPPGPGRPHHLAPRPRRARLAVGGRGRAWPSGSGPGTSCRCPWRPRWPPS